MYRMEAATLRQAQLRVCLVIFLNLYLLHMHTGPVVKSGSYMQIVLKCTCTVFFLCNTLLVVIYV